VLEIIRKYSKTVEPASIDEFYFDLTPAKTFKKAGEICKKIKEEIRKKEKITCSVGIGPNKLIAKIAAGERKPDGFLVVRQEDAERFLEPLLIRKIPGIGPKTAEIFQKMGINTVKELKKISIEEMHETLGKHGEDIYWKARGVDDSLIEENREVKSIGEQETFMQDTSDAVPILEAIGKMCSSVFKTFQESGFTGFKTIVVIVRFSNFQTTTFSHTLKDYFGQEDFQKFKLETVKSILPFLDRRKNPNGRQIRLLGVRIEKLK
jgi:DNA polymerase IV (DinB-like DNA polymerase)